MELNSCFQFVRTLSEQPESSVKDWWFIGLIAIDVSYEQETRLIQEFNSHQDTETEKRNTQTQTRWKAARNKAFPWPLGGVA